jgi:uncharacterized protein (TIGR02246 family)
MRRALVLLVILTAVISTVSGPASAADDERAVLDTFEVLRSAVNTGDVDAFVGHVTDDFMLLDVGASGAPIVGRQALVTALQGFFGGSNLTWDSIQADEVAVVGDLAFHRYEGVLTARPKDGAEASLDHRRYLDVFRRDAEGHWRLWQHIFAPLAAGQ